MRILLLAVSVTVALVVAGTAAGQESASRSVGHCMIEPFAHCAGADLSLADLHRADLRGADLRGARLGAAFASEATLVGADLRGADLRGTDLTGADLRSARLAGADLSDAVLRLARLSSGGLTGARLCHTTLPAHGAADRDCASAAPATAIPAQADVDRGAASAAPPPAIAGQARSAARRSPARQRTKAKARTVGLAVRITGPGTVRSRGSKAIRCPGNCFARVPAGKRVVLIAKANRGASFDGWTQGCRKRSGTCVLKPQKGTRVRAAFQQNRAASQPPPARPGAPSPPAPPLTPSMPLAPSGACPYGPGEDSDHDGILDCLELAGWTFKVRTPADLSGDGQFASRTVTSVVGNPDTDGDGLSDGAEYNFNGDPRSPDTDQDGLGDLDEQTTYRSDLNDADTDGDSLYSAGMPRSARLFDGNEVHELGTNPRDPDTDGDGLSDYYEAILGGTPARIANLPEVELIAVPGQSNVQVDLGYSVKETTGTEKESASSTQASNGQTRSSGGSTETTNELSESHEVGGGCHAGVSEGLPDDGCEVHYQYTNTQTDSTTKGSTWGFDNSHELSEENEKMASLSAEREVTFDPSGCLQVILRVHNAGSVAVTIDDFQVLATTPDPDHPGQSKLLATLLPVSGQIYTEDCPATDSNFGKKTIPPSGSVDIGFSQQVEAQILREYIAKPSPIKFSLGAISMTGTNLAGQEVNFLGDVATKVREKDANIQVDFGAGEIENLSLAAGTLLKADGSSAGITLAEALGPELANFSPVYTAATETAPGKIESLVNRRTSTAVVNDPALHAYWNLVGDASQIGPAATDWKDVVLHPGDAISLAYSRFSDSDTLSDAAEQLIGTNPENPDTDGDGLDDDVEAREGWIVPMAREGKPEYRVYPSPLSCDADGDKSPDGSGPGNSTYGLCPKGQGPESTRARVHPTEPLEGTDPALADTNGDNLLDGAQAFPDVLKAVPFGGEVPVFLRQWGGSGPGSGNFTEARDIAVDPNKPLLNGEGHLNSDVEAYVIDHLPVEQEDLIQKFSGNPLAEIPQYDASLKANSVEDLSASPAGNEHLTVGAVGLAVGTGSVTTGAGPFSGVAGSPVIANYYPKDDEQTVDDQGPNAFLTTFNGTSGEDLNSYATAGGNPIPFNLAFAYGITDPPPGDYFSPPWLDLTNAMANGRLDLGVGNVPIVAHGTSSYSPALDPMARPTEYPQNQSVRRFGSKPATLAPPTQGQLLDPSGVAVDRANGKLYVADDLTEHFTGGNITRFDLASGQAERFLANSTELSGIRGLAVDPDGKFLYAAAGSYVYKLSPDLSILARFGGAGTTAGHGSGGMVSPWDVDVDASHGTWVTDSTTNLVQYLYYP